MQSTKLISLLVILPAVTDAADCPAGYKFKTALATTKCDGGGWGVNGLKNCETSCCDKDLLACAHVTDADCGTDKYRASGITTATQKAWGAKTFTPPVGAEAGTKVADCCKAGLTCADVTTATCQAAGGKKKNAKTTDKCPGAYTSACLSICCEDDPLTCGGIGALGCDAATQYEPSSLEKTVAWKNTQCTADNKAATCCKTRAACSSFTCPAGYKAEATGTAKCTGSTVSCTKAACCVSDTLTCGGSTTACTGTTYKDDTKAATKFTTFQTDCCTEKPKCSTASCDAGYKAVADAATKVCDGAIAECTDSVCCEKDANTCLGQKDSLVCAAGGYSPLAVWTKDYKDATTTAEKKAIEAKAAAWYELVTNAANAKNLQTNTAAPGCCLKESTCSEFKAHVKAGLIGGAHNLQPGLFSLLVGLVAFALLYMK